MSGLTNGSHPDPTVLLCYDGSRESAIAIARAGELVSARRAVVANVWEGVATLRQAPLAGPSPSAIADAAGMIDDNDRDRAQKLAAEGVALARDAGFDATAVPLRLERNVWWTLNEYAKKHHINTIAVGARGRSRVARTLLGSTSSGLLHHATATVLVVPATATEPSGGPVMFCDDGSDNARQAVRRGRQLLRGAGMVVSLWRSWAVNVPYMVVGAGAAVGMAEELDKGNEEQASETAAEGAQAAAEGGTGCHSESVRCDGPTWRGLLDTANDRDAAAIVVGTRGMTGIAGALGSVATAVSQHSPRPVLVVPPTR